MSTILLVDDHIPSLANLQAGFRTLGTNFEILLAENGQEAITLLEKTQVDLLVTDLNMPIADGFDLLAYIKRARSDLPFVVVTGMAPPEYLERLEAFGNTSIFSKPADPKRLAEEIERLLAEKSSGNLHGVTLPGFLQLVQMERKSCSVRVSAGELQGRLHFLSGELVNAFTFGDGAEGELAARRILGWHDVDIEIERSYHNHRRLIQKSLQELLLKAAVEADESGQPARPGPERSPGRDPDPPPDAAPASPPRETPPERASERELLVALTRLTERANGVDAAIAAFVEEIQNFRATRERVAEADRKAHERRGNLEELRRDAEDVARKLLTATLQPIDDA